MLTKFVIEKLVFAVWLSLGKRLITEENKILKMQNYFLLTFPALFTASMSTTPCVVLKASGEVLDINVDLNVGSGGVHGVVGGISLWLCYSDFFSQMRNFRDPFIYAL